MSFSLVWLADMPWSVWLPVILVVGATLGSFLNVAIHRLPLEKSILWPGSRCGHCLQPIRWYDNIPLVSYWLLRGRCRVCQAPFSIRYFGVELLTALIFVGLYYLEVVENVHRLDANILGPARADEGRLVLFAYHAALVSFLLVATFCDFDYQIIPLPLTVTGTIVGLIGSMFLPWPWPYTPAEAAQGLSAESPFWFHNLVVQLKGGVYPWPFWWPLPAWFQPGGNWQTGLATSLLGILAGTMLLRLVRFLFGFGRGPEYTEPEDPELAPRSRWLLGRVWSWLGRVGGKALGLGDADLMMMAGSFLGWQVVLVGFFGGVFPGLFLGIAQLFLRGNQPFAFGPALAIGLVMTFLGWSWLVPILQPLLFDGTLMLILAGMCGLFLLLAGFVLRLLRMLRS